MSQNAEFILCVKSGPSPGPLPMLAVWKATLRRSPRRAKRDSFSAAINKRRIAHRGHHAERLDASFLASSRASMLISWSVSMCSVTNEMERRASLNTFVGQRSIVR